MEHFAHGHVINDITWNWSISVQQLLSKFLRKPTNIYRIVAYFTMSRDWGSHGSLTSNSREQSSRERIYSCFITSSKNAHIPV